LGKSIVGGLVSRDDAAVRKIVTIVPVQGLSYYARPVTDITYIAYASFRRNLLRWYLSGVLAMFVDIGSTCVIW